MSFKFKYFSVSLPILHWIYYVIIPWYYPEVKTFKADYGLQKCIIDKYKTSVYKPALKIHAVNNRISQHTFLHFFVIDKRKMGGGGKKIMIIQVRSQGGLKNIHTVFYHRIRRACYSRWTGQGEIKVL